MNLGHSNVRLLIFAILWVTPAMLWGQSPYDSLSITIEPYSGVYRVIVQTPDRKNVSQDVRLQVVAGTSVNYQSRRSTVSTDLVIPAGSNQGIAEVPMGNRSDLGWYQTNLIIEDNDNGALDSRDFMSHTFTPQGNWIRLDHILFVSSNITSANSRQFMGNRRRQTDLNWGSVGVADPAQLPNFIGLVDLYTSLSLITNGSVTTNLSFLQNQNARLQAIHPGDFFQNWTSLFGFNAVLLSKQDFLALSKTESQFNALKKWLSVGGQLIIFDCQKEYKDRNSLMKVITGNVEQNRQWDRPTDTLMRLSGFASTQQWQINQSTNLFDASDLPNQRFVATDLTKPEVLIKTDFLAGRVFMIDDDLTSWKKKNWEILYNCMNRSSVVAAMGTKSTDRDFKEDFLIPGIGDPPVTAFQVLIAAFVLVIGPGFYYFFNRSGRLYLLLMAIPAFSIFAVSSLFMYAIVNDGFSTRGRIHSFTEIDHKSDRGYTNTRNVFYSGVSPNVSVFDNETLVMDSRSQYSPPTRFKYRDDVQTVSGGMIRARSPFQFSTLHCFEEEKQVSISGFNGQSATITNGFENEFSFIVAHTKNGWYFAESVPGESAILAESISKPELNNKVRMQIKRMNVKTEPSAFGFRKDYYSYYYIDDSVSTVQSEWGVAFDVITGLENGKVDQLLPVNSYLAISPANKRAVNPQKQAIFEGNQLHVTIGKW